MTDGQAVAVSLAGPVRRDRARPRRLGAAAPGTSVPGSPITEQLVRDMVWVNILWGLANLVPVLPLDGGHVMERTIHRISPRALLHAPLRDLDPRGRSPLGIYAWVERYPFGALFALMFAGINFSGCSTASRSRSGTPGSPEPRRHSPSSTRPIPTRPSRCSRHRPARSCRPSWRSGPGWVWPGRWRGATSPATSSRSPSSSPSSTATPTPRCSPRGPRPVRTGGPRRSPSCHAASRWTRPSLPVWYVQRMLPTTEHATQLAEWIGQLDLAHRHVGLGRLAVSLERSGRPAGRGSGPAT